MKGILNENVILKEYESDKPLVQKIDSIIHIRIRDCHNKYFHTFDQIIFVYIILFFTNIANNETVTLTISDNNMSLYELKKKNCSTIWFFI